jgi:plastocyanin
MRLRRCYIPLAAVLGAAVVMLPVAAGSEPPTPVEARNTPANGYYEEKHYWLPQQQTVIAGSVVTFLNASTTVYHGVHWISGPNTPVCSSGVPVGTEPKDSRINWTGTCKFTEPGTYIFYCTQHGPEMTGTITVTNPGEPVATTEAAESVTETGATLRGTVNSNGHPTTYYFKYGSTTSYGKETSVSPPVEGTNVSASALVTVPMPGTYHFRLVAKNEKGTVEGADQTFTTPGPPSATTGQATSVRETEVTLNGTFNPDGKPTKSYFEWGTSTGYGQTTEAGPASEDHSSHPASANLIKLASGTVYHFRLVAKNASEEVRGNDQMFTTTSLSSPPSEPSPVSTTTSTTPPSTTTTHAEPSPVPPLAGSPSLRASQRGSSVRGSLEIASSGVGGRLEVDLLAKGASLAKTRRSGSIRVGRLVRASVSAGKLSFAVALTAAGKRALVRKHRLPLTVKITLTPTRGAAVNVTRSVVLHA